MSRILHDQIAPGIEEMEITMHWEQVTLNQDGIAGGSGFRRLNFTE